MGTALATVRAGMRRFGSHAHCPWASFARQVTAVPGICRRPVEMACLGLAEEAILSGVPIRVAAIFRAGAGPGVQAPPSWCRLGAWAPFLGRAALMHAAATDARRRWSPWRAVQQKKKKKKKNVLCLNPPLKKKKKKKKK